MNTSRAMQSPPLSEQVGPRGEPDYLGSRADRIGRRAEWVLFVDCHQPHAVQREALLLHGCCISSGHSHECLSFLLDTGAICAPFCGNTSGWAVSMGADRLISYR